MKKGFTLIELLAVILILGIIALIAIPAVNNVIEDSRKGAETTTINHIIKAYEDYYQLKLLKGDESSEIIMDCLDSTKNYTTEQVVEEIGINGDIHDLDDYVSFKLDENGNALIEYDFGNFTCSNIKEEGNTKTALPNGSCGPKKNRS